MEHIISKNSSSRAIKKWDMEFQRGQNRTGRPQILNQ